ncbi:hypothetical protein AB205_0024970 [Aquarana catesbeiana]|uniref:Uncharacterized protein n=1 Tax=Aquarana catesbeiana TaxID=8400 RepID=A0A2G9QEJ9_AQUCT|nr:hypothetical protein AB205_0024970 [Aquarana catesbeiana]
MVRKGGKLSLIGSLTKKKYLPHAIQRINGWSYVLRCRAFTLL